ncbi:MAG: LemA family protein [Syntrophobacteraceae bacterium]|nr:LemA family protein [Syntrophobacteraceae bacterium]NTV43103.1 LemA family protein [Syntrophobacteraceae bacterium]
MFWAVIVLMAVGASVVFLFIAIYNRFIRGKNLVQEAWSGIDVQLKRRHDLIPNILESVKGYMQYEQKTLQSIVDLRGRSMSTESVKEKAQVEGEISRTLKSIFALAEAYPDLKASQTFLDLQGNLASIEEQLQLARRYYNGAVRDYNILVESFPSVIVARMYNFQLAEFFEIESAAEREVPAVKF